jgi:hypothetical protein
MLAGSTRHRDSLGNLGVIGPGEVQWMTSGSGILHEEMPRRGAHGRVRGFQLWVNLPAADKMGRPRYQGVAAGDIPLIEQGGAAVRLIAGSWQGRQGPVAEIAAQPIYVDVSLRPGAEFRLDLPEAHTAMLYLFEGSVGFEPHPPAEWVQAVNMIWLGHGGEVLVKASAVKGARFVLFAGSPFGEPIYPYGPFVMNTRQEIELAIHELRTGNFIKEGAGWRKGGLASSQ